ncbi:MAG: hypothetical protein M1361_01140 [Patescibacteria group bacterium]|nr:hypothetical protein [Patescibacteria group bacterium]MCL5224208.1 hypothetical protein [Patescibacteria group bacterium]
MPKLRLGTQQPAKSKDGKIYNAIVPNGPHRLKFLDEPVVIIANINGKPGKVLKFTVEENGQKFRWIVKILNAEGQPNYLLEHLEPVMVGEERIVEMKNKGARKFIEIRKVGEESASEDETDEIVDYKEDEGLSEDELNEMSRRAKEDLKE